MATIYDTIAVIIDKARDHANEAREDRHPATMVLAIHELAAAVSNLADLSEKHEGRLAAVECEKQRADAAENLLRSATKERDSFAGQRRRLASVVKFLACVEGVDFAEYGLADDLAMAEAILEETDHA